MSYLKLRELWNECESLDENTWNVFVEGLKEIHNKKFGSYAKPDEKQSVKPCVAQDPRATRNNGGRWEPQEDDLLRQCVSRSRNPHQGFVSFAKDPANKKRRTKDAAQQRYYDLINGSKF